ncbi:Aquaporin-2 [Grifola frondosa]|uniref:Aquaporin-2 n=1 Tax=Grifola frondosa TaxID=5627 RepID=A0A1C7M7Q8_GRIFR|nr:Aquaporin-2 [Grifola frondosa]
MPLFTRSPKSENSSAGARPKRSFISSQDLIAALFEYVGTTVFLTLAFGGVQAAQAEPSNPTSPTSVERVLYISLSMGFSLLVSAWLFFRVTGGLFNPNVSLALLLTCVIGPVRFVLYCIAQLLGGITAAALVLALTSGPLASNTSLQGINAAQGVFIEAFVTAALVLSVLMLAAEKHTATPFAPVGIGLTLFVGHLWAVFYTGAAINTARAFGPAVVTGFPDSHHWVYWVGPFTVPSLEQGFTHSSSSTLQYWRLNPGQDTVDSRESPPDPVRSVKSMMVISREPQSSVGHDQRRMSGDPSDEGTVVADRGRRNDSLV